MTHHAELRAHGLLRHVGWLDAPHPFPTGPVSSEDFARLEQLVVHTWLPMWVSHGWHDCSLCGRQQGDGPIMRNIEGENRLLGGGEIYVPDGDLMYSAPTLILHYIEDHQYLPPEVFLSAVRKTDPLSEDYQPACDRLQRLQTQMTST